MGPSLDMGEIGEFLSQFGSQLSADHGKGDGSGFALKLTQDLDGFLGQKTFVETEELTELHGRSLEFPQGLHNAGGIPDPVLKLSLFLGILRAQPTNGVFAQLRQPYFAGQTPQLHRPG